MNKLYAHIDRVYWKDWHWQLKNACRSVDDFISIFPNLSEERVVLLRKHAAHYTFSVTPYILSIINLDEKGNPVVDDPILNQIHCEKEIYNGEKIPDDNWEAPGEVKFGILHQKYPGRALLRLSSSCFSYCSYCYCAHRTIQADAGDRSFESKENWKNILRYLKQRGDIFEVLLSGGDPLMYSNTVLERILSDLRGIPSIRNIRINTRAFTFCPQRIDRELVAIIQKYNVTAVEVHFCHSREITPEVEEAVTLFSSAGSKPVFLSRAPLLAGINDSEEELERLFLRLYDNGILPYYIFHFAPDMLGRDVMGVPLRRGAELLRTIRRRVPGPAFPRYTLFHKTGKQDVPLNQDGSDEFKYEKDTAGKPVVRFKNWKGQWVLYPDVI